MRPCCSPVIPSLHNITVYINLGTSSLQQTFYLQIVLQQKYKSSITQVIAKATAMVIKLLVLSQQDQTPCMVQSNLMTIAIAKALYLFLWFKSCSCYSTNKMSQSNVYSKYTLGQSISRAKENREDIYCKSTSFDCIKIELFGQFWVIIGCQDSYDLSECHWVCFSQAPTWCIPVPLCPKSTQTGYPRHINMLSIKIARHNLRRRLGKADPLSL